MHFCSVLMSQISQKRKEHACVYINNCVIETDSMRVSYGYVNTNF